MPRIKRKLKRRLKRKPESSRKRKSPKSSKRKGGFLSGKDGIKNYRNENNPGICPILGIDIVEDPVLDHDHQTGKVRGVLSRTGNVWLGKMENYFRGRCGPSKKTFLEALECAVQYFKDAERDAAELPLHPEGLRQVVKRFGSKPSAEQKQILLDLGIFGDEIAQAKNRTKRMNLLRKHLKET